MAGNCGDRPGDIRRRNMEPGRDPGIWLSGEWGSPSRNPPKKQNNSSPSSRQNSTDLVWSGREMGNDRGGWKGQEDKVKGKR